MLFPTSRWSAVTAPDWLIDRARLRACSPTPGPGHLALAVRPVIPWSALRRDRTGPSLAQPCPGWTPDRLVTSPKLLQPVLTCPSDGGVSSIISCAGGLYRCFEPNLVPRLTGPILPVIRSEVERHGSCAPAPPGPSRSQCRARSPWPSKARNDSTASPRNLALAYASRSTRRWRTCSRRVRTSSSSMIALPQARPDEARKYGCAAINRALAA